MAETNTPVPRALSNIEKSVGILITLLTGIAAFHSSTIKDSIARQAESLDQMKIEIAKRADDREGLKLSNDITMKIFDEVKDIYKTPNQTPDQMLNRLLSVSALVEAVPQSDVRIRLAAAVEAAADHVTTTMAKPTDEIKRKVDVVKSKVDVTVFRADQNDLPSPSKDRQNQAAAASGSSVDSPKWANYDFDFFWCESAGNPEAVKTMTEMAMAAARKADPTASGRWRVRKLPAEINRRPEYGISGYKILVTSDDEQKIAGVLSGVLKQHGVPEKGAEFEIKRLQYSTPWYVSVFFCPAGPIAAR